jgi:N-methylhydantoinase A
MRYSGQSHEITVPIERKTQNLARITREEFEAMHKKKYGYDMKDKDVEWVTARVTTRASHGLSFRDPTLPERGGWPIDTREVVLSDGSKVLADVFRRERLAHTQQAEGAAIIEQLDTTTWVAPGWIAEQNLDGTLWLWREDND